MQDGAGERRPGADTMAGGTASDLYYVDDERDVIIETDAPGIERAALIGLLHRVAYSLCRSRQPPLYRHD